MQYLLLIYGDESRQGSLAPEEMEVALKGWWDYTDWLREKGWFLGGEALKPTSAATTVREREGQLLTTDGPFMETKEQLGGYYLLECENLDQAIEATSRMPILGREGSVEIRPIQKFEGQPS
jgi:hypothetical protein